MASTSVCSCEASMRPGAKGTFTLWPAFFAACSTPAPPARTIRSASEIFLPPEAAPLNSFWMPSSFCRTFASWAGWLTSQSFCGARRMRAQLAPPRLAEPRKVAAAALVGAPKRGRRRPGGGNQLRDRQSGSQHFALERGDVLIVDQLVVDRGNRVLPEELFLRHFRSQVAGARAHVAVNQLEPGAREGMGEGLRVVEEPARDLPEFRIEAHRQVGGQHGRLMLLRRVVRVGNDLLRVLGHPLLGAGRRLSQLPFVLEQVLEVVVAPQRRSLGPGHFNAAGNRVGAVPRAIVA